MPRKTPLIRPLHAALYAAHRAAGGVAAHVMRAAWWTPMFLSRVETPAPGLRLEGGMPLVLGPLRLRLGRDVRLSGASTLSGRPGTQPAPLLEVGDNIDIGWQTTIAVGTVVLSASGLLNSVLDEMDAFAATLVVGIALLFTGFLVTTSAPPRRLHAVADQAADPRVPSSAHG